MHPYRSQVLLCTELTEQSQGALLDTGRDGSCEGLFSYPAGNTALPSPLQPLLQDSPWNLCLLLQLQSVISKKRTKYVDSDPMLSLPCCRTSYSLINSKAN